MEAEKNKQSNKSLRWKDRLVSVVLISLLCSTLLILIYYTGLPIIHNYKISKQAAQIKVYNNQEYWIAPDTNDIASQENAISIWYGRELIKNTAQYFGPRGENKNATNGMNCQNCHLEAGTKLYGNNYSAVASNYPKFRERSGSIETIRKRVNDCFERSLNGAPLDTNGKEMEAIVAYIKWLGKDVPKKIKPKGAGLTELTYLKRAADPKKGKELYALRCKSCHNENGSGVLKEDKIAYKYPPLWGKYSYNTGAGLFRLSRLAGYIKSNMPLGADFENPKLSDEQAWDIAAYVNSQPRPRKKITKDWPNIASKPIDHPFGPYADSFSETQHKYGPFEPIAQAKQK